DPHMLFSHAQLQGELTLRLAILVDRLDGINLRLSNNRAIERAATGTGTNSSSLLDQLIRANGNLSDELNNLAVTINVLDQLIGPDEFGDQPPAADPIPDFLQQRSTHPFETGEV